MNLEPVNVLYGNSVSTSSLKIYLKTRQVKTSFKIAVRWSLVIVFKIIVIVKIIKTIK